MRTESMSGGVHSEGGRLEQEKIEDRKEEGIDPVLEPPGRKHDCCLIDFRTVKPFSSFG